MHMINVDADKQTDKSENVQLVHNETTKSALLKLP